MRAAAPIRWRQERYSFDSFRRFLRKRQSLKHL